MRWDGAMWGCEDMWIEMGCVGVGWDGVGQRRPECGGVR